MKPSFDCYGFIADIVAVKGCPYYCRIIRFGIKTGLVRVQQLHGKARMWVVPSKIIFARQAIPEKQKVAVTRENRRKSPHNLRGV